MRMMVYRGTGGLTVAGDGFGRTFDPTPHQGHRLGHPDNDLRGLDAVALYVDFDAVAGHVERDVVVDASVEPPNTERRRIAVTWGEAIGERYAHLFKPAKETDHDDTFQARARARQPRATPTVEASDVKDN